MGMDVYSKDEQHYFRANVWTWRPLHVLIKALSDGLIDEETLSMMEYNDGAGLDSTEECKELAGRIQAFLDQHPKLEKFGFDYVSINPYVKDELKISHFPYFIYRDHIQEFVDFLNKADGFKVF